MSLGPIVEKSWLLGGILGASKGPSGVRSFIDWDLFFFLAVQSDSVHRTPTVNKLEESAMALAQE